MHKLHISCLYKLYMSGEQKQTQCCHVYAHLCVTQDVTVDPEKEADRRAEEMEFGEKEKTRPSVIGRMGAVAPCTPHIRAFMHIGPKHVDTPCTAHRAAPRRNRMHTLHKLHASHAHTQALQASASATAGFV